ncbi:MAG: hypothetical protein IJ757_05515 [Clostridiales bacterium]|nr:hypothetical protein [Clostridiales bacterium]
MKRKLIATVLSVSMLASLSGCALFDKDDEGVLKAAEDYATAVTKAKAGDIIEALKDGEDYEDTLNDLMSGMGAGPEEYSDIVSAIAGTISYEIDEESVASSKKNAEGSVDITWTIVDYDSIFEDISDEGGDADAFIDALGDEDADTIEISQTLNLVLEDETWLIDDEDIEGLSEIYDFYAAAIGYTFVLPLADYISYDTWYYSDDSVYSNVSRIELDLIITDEGETVPFDFTYEYYFNGDLIFTSDECYDMGHWIEAYYGPDYDSAAQVNADGNLIAGEYRCVMYDLAGNVLADNTCTVEEVTYGDADTSMIDHIEWYWTDHDNVYVDDDGIELDIIPTTEGQEAVWTFWYEVYLDDALVYTSDECTDQGYWIEAYYNSYYDGALTNDDGNLVAGDYTIIMYDMAGNVLANETCIVEES